MATRRDETWLADWLDGVVRGTSVMSQRSMASIDRHGGIERVIEAALARGVHLVQLTDERGKELVAASLKPLRTLC